MHCIYFCLRFHLTSINLEQINSCNPDSQRPEGFSSLGVRGGRQFCKCKNANLHYYASWDWHYKNSEWMMGQQTLCNQYFQEVQVVYLPFPFSSVSLGALDPTLGAATGLFRCGDMSKLHSLPEWKLTTCGTTPHPPWTHTHTYTPSGLVLSESHIAKSTQMCHQNIPMVMHIWTSLFSTPPCMCCITYTFLTLTSYANIFYFYFF